jgi:predicted Zn-dependent protease
MKKVFCLIAISVLLTGIVQAQSIRDGIKELYSGRYNDAVRILEKQNSPEGVYWLARTYVMKDRLDMAKNVFDKALAANPTAPYLLVGKGFFLLKDKKVDESKQAFEMALTNSRGRKGDDPVILNAVGRAITQVYNNVEKVGDINYAVDKLKEAANQLKNSKDAWFVADVNTNLGDALRKQNPGEGSAAFSAYQDALMADPNFAQANYRKALIFKSQRNWPLFLDNVNKAVATDPNFIPGYEELYLYKLGTKDFSGAQTVAEQIIQHSPGNPNNEYYRASTYYLNKKYDDAIASSKHLIAAGNEGMNPAVYKLIAYCLLEKKDTAAAIPYVENYFNVQKPERFTPEDYSLKAMAYSTTPGKENQVYQSYLDGLKMDTIVNDKIDLINDGAKFMASKGQYGLQGDLLAKIIDIKSPERLILNDYFYAGYPYYKAKQYEKSWKMFDGLRTKFPNVNFGYLWAFNNSKLFDSTNAKNIVVPDAEKLIAFSRTDSSSDAKSNAFSASFFLANYYNDVAKNKAKAAEYLKIAKDNIDDLGAKQSLQESIDRLSKPQSAPRAPARPTPPAKTKNKGGR